MEKIGKNWEDEERVFFEYWKNRLTVSPILQNLPKEIASDWNNASFKMIDSFLEEHCKSITCADVSAIYWKFWWDLKKIKSNSTNFVGYSEFLILRLLLHFLKKEYFAKISKELYSKPNPDSPNSDLGYFELGENLIVATECIPKIFRKTLAEKTRKRKPDILIYKEKPLKILAIIQVKSFPPSAESVKNDLNFFKVINTYSAHKNVDGLILIFSEFNKRSSLKWSDKRICSLWDKEEPISEIFRQGLNLDKIRQYKSSSSLP